MHPADFHSFCGGLICHLKGNSIPNINLCAQVGSLLIVKKSACLVITDNQRPGSIIGMSLCMGVRGGWTTELVPTYTAQTIWFHSCLQSSSCVNIQDIPIMLWAVLEHMLVSAETSTEQYLQPDVRPEQCVTHSVKMLSDPWLKPMASFWS